MFAVCGASARVLVTGSRKQRAHAHLRAAVGAVDDQDALALALLQRFHQPRVRALLGLGQRRALPRPLLPEHAVAVDEAAGANRQAPRKLRRRMHTQCTLGIRRATHTPHRGQQTKQSIQTRT
eukprot:2025585-Rhodomonas_salina.2